MRKEISIADSLQYTTVDPDTGEVIFHRADETFEQRAQELQEMAAQSEMQNKLRKNSPYKEWAQLNLEYTPELIQLAKISSRALELFLFFVKHMDNYNALICSYKVIESALGISTPTITRALKVLKNYGFIEIKKSGTNNIYLINKELVWKSWGSNYKYAEFGAKVIIADFEQEQEQKKK